MSKRPHLIYIVVHDLGRTLGCYDRPIVSPNLDAFARRGVLFDNAFCTAAACSPSRACVMTGQYPQTSGGLGLAHMGWSLRPQVRTIVDELNDGGYETAHFGLNHERHAQLNRYQIDRETDWDQQKVKAAVDHAVEFLHQRVNTEQPFYLNLGTQEVRSVLWNNLTPPEVEDKYGYPVEPDKAYVPPHLPDTYEARLMMAKFAACIHYMDQHIGRLLGTLDQLGYFENSVIMYATDHGISAARAKGTLYDRGTEIAMMMHLPEGCRNGRRVQQMVPNIDIAPTLLEAAGVALPARMQGRSFWPLLTGNGYQAHTHLYSARNFHGQNVTHRKGFVDFYDPVRAVRTERWKYVRNVTLRPREWMPGDPLEWWERGGIDMAGMLPPARPMEELYDLASDPEEWHNLADEPAHADIKAELSRRLTQWQIETNDHALRGEVPVRPEAHGWGDNWPVRQ